MSVRMLLSRWAAVIVLVLVALALGSAVIWRDDIVRTWLDPKQPFQTYQPPPAPDYGRPEAWALIPSRPSLWSPADPAADAFFIHPTTFDGGANWNGPIGDRHADQFLSEVILPNYAGPFQQLARVFAPRYRQASLYAFMTNKEDAQESRRFAFPDIKRAFDTYLKLYNDGRPVVLVGVEQGGGLAARLADEELASDPTLKGRLAAVYLIDTIVPADRYGAGSALPACVKAAEAGCVLAWETALGSADAAQLAKRAMVWSPSGQLEDLGARAPLCVNPVLGAVSDKEAPTRLNLGATNATGLEWGARPAFLPRQVSTQCVAGFLQVSAPQSPSLRRSGGWTARLKEAPFNLFYADEEADAKSRVGALVSAPGYAPPIPSSGASITVVHSPIHQAQ